MKRGLFYSISIALISILIFCSIVLIPIPVHTNDAPFVKFRTNQKSFEINEGGSWKPFKMVGVNLGTGYPGLYPNENAIKKDVYSNWFKQISDMNVNVIRVYQLQSPEFYASLAKYNKHHDKKLYLVQSLDFNDKLMYTDKNLFSEEIMGKLFKQAKNTVNAIHGDHISLNKNNHSLDIYWSDVSPYVIGYCLGVEWDELFVKYVCDTNKQIQAYAGEYFVSDAKATPFEVFLAGWCETIISHEESRYNEQKLISICNWAETDPLKNEIDIGNLFLDEKVIGEDRIEAAKNIEAFVDSDNIIPTNKLKSGMFASYNIYPYYPNFLQLGKYTKYVDKRGQKNPYEGYLKELNAHHKHPVVITEYGIPSSRTVTHEDIWRNFSHGGLNEKQQGETIVKLFEYINEAGCAGSFVFTWQDEWYKRAWNEMAFSGPNERAFWSNEQCVEQLFGILAFEPNKEGKTVYPDGDISDWSKKDIIQKNDKFTLSMKSDEKYVYFMVNGINKNTNNNAINIAVDTLPKSGVNTQNSKNFARGVDFILKIGRNKRGYLYVDSAYDTCPFSMYNKLQSGMNINNMLQRKDDYKKNIIPMYQGSDFNLVLRASGSITSVLSKSYSIAKAGELRFGNTNPKSPDFVSNADFFIKDDIIEIRIPWQLLNFYSPPKCEIIDNLEKNENAIKPRKIKNIYASAYFDDDTEVNDFGKFKLKSWKNPKFHERPKQSYYILQKAFGGAAS